MRVVVVGASGNVGTSLLSSLADEPAVESVVGMAPAVPDPFPENRVAPAADVARAPLDRCSRRPTPSSIWRG